MYDGGLVSDANADNGSIVTTIAAVSTAETSLCHSLCFTLVPSFSCIVVIRHSAKVLLFYTPAEGMFCNTIFVPISKFIELNKINWENLSYCLLSGKCTMF